MKQQPTWFAILLVLCGTIMSYLFALLPKETHVKTFCAYNRVFIEFTEGNVTWGAMMLDLDGKPVLCNDDDVKTSTNYNKEMI